MLNTKLILPKQRPVLQMLLERSAELNSEREKIMEDIPKIITEERNILSWRKPSDHPCDMEDAIWVANGFGGRYSIQEDLDEFLLWMDDDEFVWKKFKTIEKCKRYAECRFQHKVRKLFLKLKGKEEL